MNRPSLFTDYYELTMAQGFFLEGRAEESACFDYFYRENPYQGGYVVFAGLTDFLSLLKDFTFREDELQFLADQGFRPDFLDYLRNLSLSLNIKAPKEGELVFPREPIVQVEGNLIEAQIVETLLLNILNFESLIATKARRMKYIAGDRKLLDFGLRRAQGFGGIQATKSAFIGGVEATSNVLVAFENHLPVSGTMAHSWVQSFSDELTAFRTYAKYYPTECILLVDTYDTLESGVPNAIKVGLELKEKGHQLKGIRLDSGDLTYLSQKARQMLDDAGLQDVKIAASNQLDEYLIRSLQNQGAPIDVFGVGTRLVTGDKSPALDGVYKLCEFNGKPNLKISENLEKTTLPGKKKSWRFYHANGKFAADGILLETESEVDTIYHPFISVNQKKVKSFQGEPIQQTVVENGKIVIDLPTPIESAAYSAKQFDRLDEEYKRFENPHVYKVGISRSLMELRDKLIQNKRNR